MVVSSRLCGFVLLGLLVAGCSTTLPPVPVEEEPVLVDATAPKVRFSSQKLRQNFQLDQDSPQGVAIRLRSSDQVNLVAVGADPESGIRQVGLQGEVRVTCRGEQSDTSRLLVEPIDDLVIAEPAGGEPLRLLEVRRLALDVEQEKTKCAPGRFVELAASLRVVAINGQGLVQESPAAQLRAFGPDQLTVGLLNVTAEQDYLDSEYLRWGAVLGRTVDVLLLHGVPDRRRAELIAVMAGLPHVALLQEENSDVVILSAQPLTDIRRQVVTPQGERPERLSAVLGAQAWFENYPIRIVAARLGTLEAQDQYAGPEVSSLSRFLAAEAIVEMLPSETEPAIVGGTLNAYSGVGPQSQPGVGTEEIALLSRRLLDSFAWLKRADGAHCSEQRLDYLMSTPTYVPTRYEACFSEAAPAAHPFVRVTFEVP